MISSGAASGTLTDTTLVVKLIDVYPNGYEAIMLDQGFMARYWRGFDKPSPLEPGRVCKLTINLWDTALVFNKGHRIGLLQGARVRDTKCIRIRSLR